MKADEFVACHREEYRTDMTDEQEECALENQECQSYDVMHGSLDEGKRITPAKIQI